ncbi:MAG: hypothetical protein VX738_16775 [Planctomycetota bacterium]|nr:hypothetical protein [Planctomycetota bacterium]
MLIRSVLLLLLCVFPFQTSSAQNDADTKGIDLRTRKAVQAFINEATKLAIDYEQNGDLQKARNMYESIYRLDNRLDGLPAKIKSLESALLDKNQVVHKLDTANGWTQIGRAYAGRAFKILTAGSYSMAPATEITAGGFPPGDVTKQGMDPELPLGALIGIYFRNKKPGKPFLVGENTLLSPEKDGVLYLKMNVPPGIVCDGVISVGTSGWFNLPAQ